MTLAEYIELHGTSVKRELQQATGLRWATIHEIAKSNHTPRVSTAKLIEFATRGEVTAASLLGVEAA